MNSVEGILTVNLSSNTICFSGIRNLLKLFIPCIYTVYGTLLMLQIYL